MSALGYHIEERFSEEQIHQRVGELASLIIADYPQQSITLIGVLSGAIPFLHDLGRALWEQGKQNVEIDTMAVDSYGSGMTSNGEPKITKDTKQAIRGKNVILVEDIVDTGYSIEALLKILSSRSPESLKVAAMLSKDERREVEVPIDYRGFSIPDEYVVGYGMDMDEQFRTMPSIGAVIFDAQDVSSLA